MDTLILCVRLAVLVAVTLTVPVVLFPVRAYQEKKTHTHTLKSTQLAYSYSYSEKYSTCILILWLVLSLHTYIYIKKKNKWVTIWSCGDSCWNACVQIRRALLQLLFPEKPFHWARHISIAVCLLIVVNILVISVPNIRDIFGIIGKMGEPQGLVSTCSSTELQKHTFQPPFQLHS